MMPTTAMTSISVSGDVSVKKSKSKSIGSPYLDIARRSDEFPYATGR